MVEKPLLQRKDGCANSEGEVEEVKEVNEVNEVKKKATRWGGESRSKLECGNEK